MGSMQSSECHTSSLRCHVFELPRHLSAVCHRERVCYVHRVSPARRHLLICSPSSPHRSWMSFLRHVHGAKDGYYCREKLQGTQKGQYDQFSVIQQSRWASLPPQLLHDVIKRLEETESTCPSRENIVLCASVCRSWWEMSRNIFCLEFTGKLTFSISLKQPGSRDGHIQCYIKRDRKNSTYHLYLGLRPDFLSGYGKFLLSAKRASHITCIEYIISMDAANISTSSKSYIGKLRSNFLGTKFVIYDNLPPSDAVSLSQMRHRSSRFSTNEVPTKVPSGNYHIAQVAYELDIFKTRPRRMHSIIYFAPNSVVEAGGTFPCQPLERLPRGREKSFRKRIFSRSSNRDCLMDLTSPLLAKISEEGSKELDDEKDVGKLQHLVLLNKAPVWHEELKCWVLNFQGRVTMASVRNFQLTAATQTPTEYSTSSHPPPLEQDQIILQFGKVARDMFTMDYRHPISAFQAFAICLSSFGNKP